MGDTNALCDCGHAGAEHVKVMVPATCTRCTCKAFTSAAVAVTDLPDAETAWTEFIKGNEGGEFPGEQNAFLAGFAAASGPWAEQLDTANRRATWEMMSRDEQIDTLTTDLDAALARNAELVELLDEFVDWRTDCIISATGCDLHGFSLDDGQKCPHQEAKQAILAADQGENHG